MVTLLLAKQTNRVRFSVTAPFSKCLYSSVVEQWICNPQTRVRFPLEAPYIIHSINISMSSFTNALIAKKLKNRDWEVMESFSYDVGKLGSGETITVPAGFVSDLVSIPRILWTIFPPDGSYSQAAVLHDWLCKKKGKVERDYNYKQVSKIFLESLTVLEVSLLTRQAMYLGVLLFGPRF